MNDVDVQWQSADGLQLVGRSWEPAGEPRAVVCLVPGLGEHCTFAVRLTGRGAPRLHGKGLEDRLAERLKLEGDDFVRAGDPPA